MRNHIFITLGLLGSLAGWSLSGCRHKPVYPNIGSLSINSRPSGAEIFVNGSFSGQRTPAKIDGLGIGENEVSLRYFGYKVWKQMVFIKAGETRILNVSLNEIQPVCVSRLYLGVYGDDMALDAVLGKLYIANRTENNLKIYRADGEEVSFLNNVYLGSRQYHVAVNTALAKVYVAIIGDTILVLDGRADIITKRLPPGLAQGYNSLSASDDGRLVCLGSNDSMLTIIDAERDVILYQHKFDGPIKDVQFQKYTHHLFISGGATGNFIVFDVEERREIVRTATGAWAGKLFISHDGLMVGICNETQRTVQAAQVGVWTFATSRRLDGVVTPDACFAHDGTHLWALENIPGGDPAPPPGSLCLIYLPEWRGVAHLILGEMPIRLVQSVDGKYLYILQQFSRDLAIYRTDTE